MRQAGHTPIAQWPDAICTGPIRYERAHNVDGFTLCDAMHGIPSFGSVCADNPPTIRGQHVRVFNYPDQTEAVAAQLVQRWNSHQALLEALRDMLAGWKYIRERHGDLYGVGWDRCQEKAESALAAVEKKT